MKSGIPVIVFAYARPSHLRRTLECLRVNQVPEIRAFSDGPASPDKAGAVAEVRRLLRSIDWCDITVCERERNLGLGRSILGGVTEVLRQREAALVFEDDLECVPGTYSYLCAALEYYREDSRVMSVTGWTHPLVTPVGLNEQPYFDGRAECWVWGTWRRAWQGMDQSAKTLMQLCEKQRIDIYRYGADLPAMAEEELQKNIWAVRFSYWHLLNRGLCLRPPWSMVDHIGFDEQATNAASIGPWAMTALQACPRQPWRWPEPAEHAACSKLWQAVYGARPSWYRRLYRRLPDSVRARLRRLPGGLRAGLRCV